MFNTNASLLTKEKSENLKGWDLMYLYHSMQLTH